MRINRIAIDLDDTISAFTLHVLQRLGCPVGPLDFDKYPIEYGFDIIGAWAEFTGNDRPPVPMWWEWVSRRTWEEAPKSNEFWLLDRAAEIVGRENVLIATSPVKSADCHYAKYQWIVNNCPEWIHRQYAITPRKKWLAQPGTLLIDDSDKNIEDFDSLGGKGLLVPRPWNKLHALSNRASEYLSVELERLATEGYEPVSTPQFYEAVEETLYQRLKPSDN